MNKSALKRFAAQTRLDLMGMVGTKLGYLLSLDESALPIEYRDHATNIRKIKERCTKNGSIDNETKEEFIEEVAYIWFNRLIALRFMDANAITEHAVISPLPEQVLPAVYTKAKEGVIEKDLNLDKDKFFNLVDGKIASSNPDNEAYKMLFISVCNYYSSIMPFMFEAISDYTELLLPDDMLSPNSIRAVVVEAMPDEDCKDVEIIGWLYQFYISQKKDDVFAALKKNKKITASNIPAATQLFTPDWIVKYMVENSLGKLWMLNNPSSMLKEQMKYYIENPDETTNFIKISSPEEITLLDPCMGSGHILTYAFDLLTKIYEEAGYNNSDIPGLILEKNIYGCDIDKRAATLAKFALTMKARMYYRRYFRKTVNLNAIELQDFGSKAFAGIKNFGSLLTPKDDEQFTEGMFAHNTAEYELQKRLLTSQYHCVITNPPYKAKSDLNQELQVFMENTYPDSKADLYAVFMERTLELTKDIGFMAMINQHAWMFLPTYKNLRPKLIENFHIDTLLHLGLGVFEDMNTKVVQNVAFTIQKAVSAHKGYYKRLFVRQGVNEKLKDKEQWFLDKTFNLFLLDQQEFKRIPEYPIAYWISEQLRKSFEDSLLGELIPVKKGLDTGNNDYFLRLWHEVNLIKIGIGLKNGSETVLYSKKWVPYNKGGDFNKWYGNKEYIINWENNGSELEKSTANLRSKHLYFKDAITWNALTFTTSARLSDYGALFDSAGSSMFPTENIYYYLAFINTKIVKSLLTIINPTMNFGAGSMSKLPVIFPNDDKRKIIEEIAMRNVAISRSDWNSREVSWDFSMNPLIKQSEDGKIKNAFERYCNDGVYLINELQKNEEKLNSYFIDIYGLNDELVAEVDLSEISIFKQEIDIVEGKPIFKADEIMKQFMSYAVGVMFGRYTLDQEGLVIANMGQATPKDTRFEIDDDNIIPILEDDYFTDDIASRFIEFVKVAFGDEHHTENIQFIEDALGTTIRKYFVKGFYDDHIKRYKKRPIYWMISSPKKSFNALIYMHRYQDDIFARVQNNYLREYITKLEAAMHIATTIANDESNSAADRRKATKDIETITKKIDELIKFDRDKLTLFAQSRTPIDLDDGVKVNYSKFEEILYPIPGLSE